MHPKSTPLPNRTCRMCGNAFYVFPSRIIEGRGTGTLCSRSCVKAKRKRDADANANVRFDAKVNPDGPIPHHHPHLGPCADWTGGQDADGYGMFFFHGRNVRAHRFAWERVHGPIPEGMVCLHSCDRPSCVRVDHVSLGTVADNNADRSRKGRSARLTGENSFARQHPERVARGERHSSRTKPERMARGERVGSAKLTRPQVADIRRLYADGGVTHNTLGERFGVSRRTISLILQGETWRDSPSQDA